MRVLGKVGQAFNGGGIAEMTKSKLSRLPHLTRVVQYEIVRNVPSSEAAAIQSNLCGREEVFGAT